MEQLCSRPLAFLHQQKSAGVSIRWTLQNVAEASSIAWEREPQRDGVCRCKNDRNSTTWFFSDEAPECDLCPHIPWITLFRDPWERMRSAYFYCHVLGDQLCYMPDYSPRRSPCDFGRRWGNYAFAKLSGLRWYLPEFKKQISCATPGLAACDCLNSSAKREVASDARLRRAPGCPASAFCRREVIRRCGLDMENATRASQELSRLVFARLHSFSAVGLLERLPESLRLFAGVAGCSTADAMVARLAHKAHASLKRDHSAAAVRKAEVTFESCKKELLERHMHLDVALYAEATRLMQAQLERASSVQRVAAARGPGRAPNVLAQRTRPFHPRRSMPRDVTLKIAQLLRPG
jgi:hypothetical protein